MPIDLTKPLAWKNASHDEKRMLKALQGNILKGHGRHGTVNIFFQIDTAKQHAMRAALREIANFHATSAYQQLVESEGYKATGKSGSTFVGMFISKTGYEALGVPAANIPPDAEFRNGMSKADLGDTPTEWEAEFQKRIDGMILVGSESENALRLKRDEIVRILKEGEATIIKEQVGHAIFNKANNGIEHFGYVDGRSQPLVLVEDIDKEARDAGIALWDPQAPLNTALVLEPNAADDVSYGSYFIFRKLEQNVLEFKRREQLLADALSLLGQQRELAGALAVGRFEDGTPVTLSDESRGLNPPNDFNYNGDAGSRCPFHGHIRKTNPRGSGGFEPLADEFKHLMLRRGIPYEDVQRKTHPSDVPETGSLAEFDAVAAPLLPNCGVGLLFMAYNRELSQQFEFTQNIWANNKTFPNQPIPSGLDPVIGQGDPSDQNWPKSWGNAGAGTVPFSFSGFVKTRGGEYFFAPSLNFLKAL